MAKHETETHKRERAARRNRRIAKEVSKMGLLKKKR